MKIFAARACMSVEFMQPAAYGGVVVQPSCTPTTYGGKV